MAENRKMTTREVANEKAERMMNGVAYWGEFYRKNPQRFCKDYLNIHLKSFQKILLYAMMVNNYFMFCASRGLGRLTSHNFNIIHTYILKIKAGRING